jgi:hypothetical protein
LFLWSLGLRCLRLHYLFILLENPISNIYDTYDDMFNITINGLKFKVTSLSNMVILYEIFIQINDDNNDNTNSCMNIYILESRLSLLEGLQTHVDI